MMCYIETQSSSDIRKTEKSYYSLKQTCLGDLLEMMVNYGDVISLVRKIITINIDNCSMFLKKKV